MRGRKTAAALLLHMAVYVLGLEHPNATPTQIWGATAEGYC